MRWRAMANTDMAGRSRLSGCIWSLDGSLWTRSQPRAISRVPCITPFPLSRNPPTTIVGRHRVPVATLTFVRMHELRSWRWLSSHRSGFRDHDRPARR